jgi:hypothetical protein
MKPPVALALGPVIEINLLTAPLFFCLRSPGMGPCVLLAGRCGPFRRVAMVWRRPSAEEKAEIDAVLAYRPERNHAR